MTRTREDTIADLVAECLALEEDGVEAIPFTEICSKHPELREHVVRGVAAAARLKSMPLTGAPPDPRLGTLFADRYRIVDRMGHGAMGVVYAATDLELGRPVAVKVVHAGFADQSKAYERFDREAAALASVTHDSIVTIFDRGLTDEGAPFLVMEKIDGVSCADLLESATNRADDDSSWLKSEYDLKGIDEPSFLRQSVRWMVSVASAIRAAHDAGIYHRDIKPSNIMIRQDGRAVLLDFGIAAREDGATLTQTGAAVGTPAYMAPESLSGKVKQRSALDVYGIAATLYHLVTLKAPYRGAPSDILTALALREPEPAFRVRPGLPRDVQAILDHGMSRNPAGRYENAEALESDLRAVLAFRPVSVRPTSSVVRVGRRLARSRMFLGALLASAVFAGLLLNSAIQTRVAESHEREFNVVAWPRIPANTGIVNPANRRIADKTLRASTAESFDALVATKHDSVSAHLVRALFRFDHGNFAGAEADMREVADAAGSKYARDLLSCYTAAAEASDPSAFGDVSVLGEPVGPDGRYLAAVHFIRIGKIDVAEEWLRGPGLEARRHAQELLFVLQGVPLGTLEAEERYGELYAESEKLINAVLDYEATTESRSATTAHMLGTCYLRQEQHVKAMRAADSAARLAPASHVALLNAGNAAFKRGLLVEAREYLTAALAVTPRYYKTEQVLAKVEAQLGHAESARGIVESIGYRNSKKGRLDRARLGAQVETDLALYFCDEEGQERMVESAIQRAVQHCEALPDDSETKIRVLAWAAAVRSGEKSAFIAASLVDLQRLPLSIRSLGDIVDFGPIEWTPEQRVNASAWIEALHEQLLRTEALELAGPGLAADPRYHRR